MAQIKGMQGSKRALYDFLRSKFGENNITPSTLRLEAVMSTGNQYSFNIKNNQGASNTERRLDNSGAFWPLHYSFFAAKRDFNAQTQLATESGTPNTYANPSVFADATERQAIQNWFLSGTLGITVGSVILMRKFALEHFYRVAEAQKGLAVSTVVGTGVYQESDYDFEKDYKEIVPSISFGGDSDIEITIKLPNGLNANCINNLAQGKQNVWVLEMDGYEIINGSRNLPQ